MKKFRLDQLIDDRPEDSVFRVNRKMFRDQELFDMEIKHIFEGGWVFIGLETQAEKPLDFFTNFIGRVPILISRDEQGELHCLINTCPHKGVRVAREQCGSAKTHVCPYHSWSFDASGKNRIVKWEKGGCYSEGFNEESHDLARVARFDNYRGFLFASLNPDVPSLDEHLGETKKMLDLVVDKSPEGVMELVPGRVRFTYAANWKMQLENCSDQYHFTSTHPSYIRILEQRSRESSDEIVTSSLGAEGSSFWQESAKGVTGGTYSFSHGHVLNWGLMEPSPSSADFERADALEKEFGADIRNWMFNMRNLTLFPNLQVAENASSQMRVIRPLAPNLTEMQTWCIAPRGESTEARRFRIRQYEDFFNPTGMATPDDTVCYEEAQRGMEDHDLEWLQGHARGYTATIEGGNAFSDILNMKPERSILCKSLTADETLSQCYFKAWAHRMQEVLT